MNWQKTAIKHLVDELDERYISSVLLFVERLAEPEQAVEAVKKAS